MAAMIAAIVSAVAGMVVLVAAIVVSNTMLAAIAIGIAIVGLILLGRDWLKQRNTVETDEAADQRADEPTSRSESALKPELFTPDVSYEEAVEGVDDDEDLDLEGKG